MSINLRTEIHDIVEMSGKQTTYERRLSALGVERIIDLMDMGAKLTSFKSSEDSILGLIGVPENRFNTWLSTQPADSQVAFNNCLDLYNSRVKNMLVQEQLDILSEFDAMVDRLDIGGRQQGSGVSKKDKMKLEILNSKAKAAAVILRQLEVSSPKKETKETGLVHAPKIVDEPQAKVYADESQQAELKKLMNREG